MFPLLFAATLNWIWVKQQIQGLWLGWEGNLSQAETQANKPTRPKSTRKKYNYCVWKRQSWPDDHSPRDPFPQYPYPSFCEISHFLDNLPFLFLPPKLYFSSLLGSHQGHECSFGSKHAKSPLHFVFFQRAKWRKDIWGKHLEEGRELM